MTSLKRLLCAAMAIAMLAGSAGAASIPVFTDSLRHWTQQAEQGDGQAQYFLGLAYAHGRGVHVDYARAHFWFSLAAARGEPGARASLERLEPRLSPAQLRKARQLMREWSMKNR